MSFPSSPLAAVIYQTRRGDGPTPPHPFVPFADRKSDCDFISPRPAETRGGSACVGDGVRVRLPACEFSRRTRCSGVEEDAVVKRSGYGAGGLQKRRPHARADSAAREKILYEVAVLRM
jgi:hypothetical protein